MKANITGLGAWGPGFCSINELHELINTQQSENRQNPDLITLPPKPAVIPARERRRAPLSVKLAVEVASQACEQAGISTSEPACVFASGMGDTDITDYMCRVLAGPDKMVSPTRFHNSVHNAPAGYWTISTGCEQAATSVAGFTHSFPVALLEAMVQVITDTRPVLLVLDDVATPTPMNDINAIGDGFAVALLLETTGTASRSLAQLSLATTDAVTAWPTLVTTPLTALYQSNPAARALALLETLILSAPNDTATLHYPLSTSCGALLQLHPIHSLRHETPTLESLHAS